MREIDGQTLTWMGTFGRTYTDRNALTLPEMEDLYRRNYGVTRTELNQDILRDISRSATILEVGANIGNQLLCLQKMGFARLYGIELQGYALRVARSRTHEVPLVQASAFRIPFRDGAFDMLFTSGLLIHVHPSRLRAIVSEIHRCARRNIWGFDTMRTSTPRFLTEGVVTFCGRRTTPGCIESSSTTWKPSKKGGSPI